MYEVVGELSAPSYFWVNTDGSVYVRTSLKNDIATEYKVHCSKIENGIRCQFCSIFLMSRDIIGIGSVCRLVKKVVGHSGLQLLKFAGPDGTL